MSHKVVKISYAMLRVTKQYENDRAEVFVELVGKADQAAIDDAFKAAKYECERALGLHRPVQCCPRDSDFDGNCDVHAALGVKRTPRHRW